MSQSLSKVLLHIVFSTKMRQELISEEVRSGLHAYVAGACRAVGSEAYRVGVTNNHVHIACNLPRILTISKLLEEIKKSSCYLKDSLKNENYSSPLVSLSFPSS
ncbi:MAG: transposase [bacterium]